MNILWSELAISDFEKNIDYLYLKWNEQVVMDFIFETERTIELIAISPHIFLKNKKSKVHIVPITKQITLYYDVKKDVVILLRFWNNYKDLNALKLK